MAIRSAHYDRRRTMVPGSSASVFAARIPYCYRDLARQSGPASGLVSITAILGEPGDTELSAPRDAFLYFRKRRASHSRMPGLSWCVTTTEARPFTRASGRRAGWSSAQAPGSALLICRSGEYLYVRA
jgi:hypothetical protein